MNITEWGPAVAAWLDRLRAAGRPTTTIRLRRYQLGRVEAAMAPLGPWAVTEDDLMTWLGSLEWGAETRRSMRSALRSFYGWGHARGLVLVNPAAELPAVKPAQPNPRPTPEDFFRHALAFADERTRLMIRIAGEVGCRRGEVAQIHANDLERDLLGWTLLVHGKGAKLRRVPLTDALAAVIRLRAGGGWLFPGNDHGHLSAHYVGRLVSRVLPDGWAMHSLRHRFATMARHEGNDLLVIMELLGHASLVTTQRYVRVPNADLRRAVISVAAAG